MLFHCPSVCISESSSPIVAAVVAAPILKSCDQRTGWLASWLFEGLLRQLLRSYPGSVLSRRSIEKVDQVFPPVSVGTRTAPKRGTARFESGPMRS